MQCLTIFIKGKIIITITKIELSLKICNETNVNKVELGNIK